MTIDGDSGEGEDHALTNDSGEENSSAEDSQYENDIKYLTKKGKGPRTLDC